MMRIGSMSKPGKCFQPLAEISPALAASAGTVTPDRIPIKRHMNPMNGADKFDILIWLCLSNGSNRFILLIAPHNP